MKFAFLIVLVASKTIIEFPELERRSADEVCQNYQNNYLWKKQNKCYIPNEEECTYGIHSQEDIDMTTKRVNFYRQLVGLNTIPTSTDQDMINTVNQASLIMDKNNILNHYLTDQNLKCWSEVGKDGARYSLIYMNKGEACSANSITAYMEDPNIDSLGHRRWILNPPLPAIAAGVSEHYSALRIVGMKETSTVKMPAFIAYPPPGPIPYNLIYKYWSFSRNYSSTWSDEHNVFPSDVKVTVKCNDTKFYIDKSTDEQNSEMYPAFVKFNAGEGKVGSYYKVTISSDSADTEWRYTVLAINCVNGKAENVNPDAFNAGYANNDGNNKKGLTAGAKAGIAIGVIAFVVIVAVVVFFVWKMKNGKEKVASQSENQ